MSGGRGRDRLIGGTGNDTLMGNQGRGCAEGWSWQGPVGWRPRDGRLQGRAQAPVRAMTGVQGSGMSR
ncbi:MAG: hypothetical protein ACREXJ_13190 [Gammaproteobacteria bacterium]